MPTYFFHGLNANLLLSWPEVIRRMAETLAIRLRFFCFFFQDFGFFHRFSTKKNRPNFRTAKTPLVLTMKRNGGPIHLTIMGVSKNRGTPKSSILIGVSIINHPFWGTPIFGNTHIFAPLEYNPCHHRFTRPHGAHPFFVSFVGFFFRAKRRAPKKPKASKISDVFCCCVFCWVAIQMVIKQKRKPKPL